MYMLTNFKKHITGSWLMIKILIDHFQLKTKKHSIQGLNQPNHLYLHPTNTNSNLTCVSIINKESVNWSSYWLHATQTYHTESSIWANIVTNLSRNIMKLSNKSFLTLKPLKQIAFTSGGIRTQAKIVFHLIWGIEINL